MKKPFFTTFANFIIFIVVAFLFQSCVDSYSREYYNKQNAKFKITSKHSECPGAYWNKSRSKKRR